MERSFPYSRILVAALALMMVAGAPVLTTPDAAAAPAPVAAAPTAVPEDVFAALATPAIGDWYAKFSDVQGEQTAPHHQNWTKLLGVDWSLTMPSSPSTKLSGVTVTMEYDLAAIGVLNACDNDTTIDAVVMELADLGTPDKIHTRYRLTKVKCAVYNVSGDAASGRPLVSLYLTVGQHMVVSYFRYAGDGTPLPKIAYLIDVISST